VSVYRYNIVLLDPMGEQVVGEGGHHDQPHAEAQGAASGRFAEAVDRVSTISSERGRAVKLNLEGEKLVLSVNNPDSGSASEEIEVSYNGDPLEIGFNARYLLDIAGQLDHEMARFDLADPGSPALVHDVSDEAALYVLMPMRV
jgi:DNA polymerase-3 subunit beta